MHERKKALEVKNSLSNEFSVLSLWHVLTLKKMLLTGVSHTFNGMPGKVLKTQDIYAFREAIR